MKNIYKYPLKLSGEKQEVKLPLEANILSLQVQNNIICFWALVEPKNCFESRYFQIFATGEDVHYKLKAYIGTVQHGPYVWHIFEVFEND